MSISEEEITNSGQLVNTIVYNYEFIDDYCGDSDDDDNDAQPNTPQLSSNLFPYSQTKFSNQTSSDGLHWLIDPNDEGSFSTCTEQRTNQQKWGPKTFSFSRHPLTLMVR